MSSNKRLFFNILSKPIFLEETKEAYMYTIVHSTGRLSTVSLFKKDLKVRCLGMYEIDRNHESLSRWSVELPKYFLDSLYEEFGKVLYAGFNAEDYSTFLRNVKNTHLRYLLREKKLSPLVDTYIPIES